MDSGINGPGTHSEISLRTKMNNSLLASQWPNTMRWISLAHIYYRKTVFNNWRKCKSRIGRDQVSREVFSVGMLHLSQLLYGIFWVGEIRTTTITYTTYSNFRTGGRRKRTAPPTTPQKAPTQRRNSLASWVWRALCSSGVACTCSPLSRHFG